MTEDEDVLANGCDLDEDGWIFRRAGGESEDEISDSGEIQIFPDGTNRQPANSEKPN